MMADNEPDELREALARIEDSRTRDRSADGTGHRCKAARQRPRARRRGSRGSWRPWWWWLRQARRQRLSALSTAVGFTGPRAASTAAVATEASAAAAAAVRTASWRVGTIACLFPLWLARMLLCRVSSDISRAAKHVSPSSSVHCPVKRSTCKLLYKLSWRLRVFFGRSLRTADSRAAGPAWTAGTPRLVLELLHRPGCDDPIMPPRRVCVFEWYHVHWFN